MPFLPSSPRLRLALSAATFALFAGGAQAGIFKCKAPDGSLVIQDSECSSSTTPLHPPKANEGPAVNLSLPLSERVKTPWDKRRLEAAIKISGIQLGLRKSVEHCQRNAPEQAAGLQSLFNNWRSERASAIATSERVIEKYLTLSERMEAFTKAHDALTAGIEMRASSDPAVNANNCKNATTKLRNLLDTRYADVYTQVEATR